MILNNNSMDIPPEMESPESSEIAMESDISIETETCDVPGSIETNSLTSMNSSINDLSVNDERMSGSHRAKAFILNTDTNDWEEIATGICSPEPSEDGEVFAIRLRTEEDTSLVLHTAYFHKGQEIGIQNETVLTWTNLDGDEAALSFESSIGCEEFWKLICRFYGKSYEEWKLKQIDEADEKLIQESEDQEQEERDEMMKNEGFYEYFEDSQVPKIEIAFPEKPEISTLTEIEEGLYQSLMIPSLRRQICEILIQYRYIPCLLEIFQYCEEFGMLLELGKLFRIFKSFFFLNGQELLKELMAEDNYLLVAGIMEYDPSLGGGGMETNMKLYRTFLSDDSKFKQVIPLNNENILQLIHQTFRLQYFKDVILAKILDEESSASIILSIRLNHMAIINAIDNDPEVLEVIRKLLQTVNMPLNDQINILKFFKEFLTIAKTVTLRKSLQIHQTVVINDFMKFITRLLNNNRPEAQAQEEEHGLEDKIKESKLLAIGLFTNFIQHDPSQIRNYLIQNDLRHEQRNLLNTVIDMFTDTKTCSPIRWQLVSALKILLDTFNPAIGVGGIIGGNPQLNPQLLNQALAQKSGEDFLNYFYPEYASRLLRPLIDFDKIVFTLATEDSFFFKENLSEANCEILFHLGEILCNFINQHKYRIKYLVLRNLILQNSLLLFKCREKHLQLTGLRIFRATLAVEDEFYFRFFIQHRSFSSLFALYKASGGDECDNLVTSAILEIFEFIRIPRDSLKALVRHLATVYRPELESYGPACVFKGILETEDRIDRESSVVSFASSQSQASNQSDQEMSPGTIEEDYFSNIEDEDENSSSNGSDYDTSEDFVPATKSVVEDDDEDDHFELLLKKNLPGSPTKKTKI